MARHKDENWQLFEGNRKPDGGFTVAHDTVQSALLMDIRDELKVISRKLSALECPNFTAIPRTLKRISRNTAKPRKAKAVGKPKLRVVR